MIAGRDVVADRLGASWMMGLVGDANGEKQIYAGKLFIAIAWHAFRRFFASLPLSSGADAKVCQAPLGHANVRFTLGLYALSFAQDKQTARTKVVQTILPQSARHLHKRGELAGKLHYGSGWHRKEESERSIWDRRLALFTDWTLVDPKSRKADNVPAVNH
jgi:hypothetical protein